MAQMGNPKKRVGILFGGKSAEHEVSIRSARNVVNAIDNNKYEVVLIAIDKTGRWFLTERAHLLSDEVVPKSLNSVREGQIWLVPQSGGNLMNLSHAAPRQEIDVVFPILHGPFGEDGTVQGLLKLAGIPFVGSSVLGSAIGMDKDVTKRLLRDAGIPIVRFLSFRSQETINLDEVIANLGLPLFVKPANLGSSVGVSKAKNKTELRRALADAFQYDNKILVEEFANARELECSVLGNENPASSVVGEIQPKHDFYSYQSKYLDDDGARLIVPAKIDDETSSLARELAVRAFKVLSCEGMARVDFFLRETGELLVNEVNTIPGFTKISMYPRLWEASGLSYTDLITRLIDLAIERFEGEAKLRTEF